MNVKKNLQKRKEILIEKQERKVEQKRDEVISILSRHFTEEEIKNYRKLIYMATSGLMGVDFDEHDIKLYIWIKNKSIFTKEEYMELYDTKIADTLEKKYKKR